MSDQMKAFWLGLFILVALTLMIWLILFLKPGFGDDGVTLKVRFSNIDRITVGSRVTFAGKPVGEVKEIREIPDPRKAPADASGNLYVYELILKVDSSVRIFSYDEIIFATTGLLGEKSIAIIPKAPPPGALSAKDVTHDVLYAHSTDKIDQTLNQLVQVADTFGDTLKQFGSFLQENHCDFNAALKGLTQATHELSSFIGNANERDVVGKMAETFSRAEAFFGRVDESRLIERMGTSFENIGLVTGNIATGEGTLGQLAHSDCLYVQLTTVLCQLRAVLDDIRNYGILYQFDRKWQRMHHAGRCYQE